MTAYTGHALPDKTAPATPQGLAITSLLPHALEAAGSMLSLPSRVATGPISKSSRFTTNIEIY